MQSTPERALAGEVQDTKSYWARPGIYPLNLGNHSMWKMLLVPFCGQGNKLKERWKLSETTQASFQNIGGKSGVSPGSATKWQYLFGEATWALRLSALSSFASNSNCTPLIGLLCRSRERTWENLPDTCQQLPPAIITSNHWERGVTSWIFANPRISSYWTQIRDSMKTSERDCVGGKWGKKCGWIHRLNKL